MAQASHGDGSVSEGAEARTEAADSAPPAVAVHPPVLFPALLLVGLLLEEFVPLSVGEWPEWLRFGVGGGAVVAAVALAGWAMLTFQRAGTSIPTFRPALGLVVGGPYRFTRNPMYVGLVLLLAGLGFVLASAWVLLLAPVFVVLLDRLVIAREEAYLAARFGEPYRRYRAGVRRWI